MSLAEMMTQAWFWRACAASTLVALTCAPLGVFLYLRRLSLVTDALAHVALPGIVVTYLIGGGLGPLATLLGAGLAGWGAAILIGRLADVKKVKSDAAIGIVFTTLFAMGVIGVSAFTHGAHIDLQCVLFGDVLGVSDTSLLMLGWMAPVILGTIVIGWRVLGLTTFDPVFAKSIGAPVVAIEMVLLSATSFTTVASFEAAGAILVIAFFIVPAATAHLICDRLSTMIACACGVGVVGALGGLWLSVVLNCSSAGAMACLLGVIYAITFLFSPRHGFLSNSLRLTDSALKERS